VEVVLIEVVDGSMDGDASNKVDAGPLFEFGDLAVVEASGASEKGVDG